MAGAAKLKIFNPADGSLFREIPADTVASIAEKAGAARVAQRGWSLRPLEARLDAVRKFKTLVEKNATRLADTLSAETGKPVRQARNELSALLPRIDYFLENLPRVLAEKTAHSDPSQKLEERVAWEPLGVVVNISAWNYPYFVGSNVFIPALLVGNAVLYKPSEFAALTGLEIAGLMHEAGVPSDVFIPIIGAGEAGAELLKQKIDGVFFTGSYRTGVRIAEAVAGRLIRVQLELGGKDPAYVCEDVDVRTAAEALADGAFYNTGQSCCSVERIYVHERIHDAFVGAFVETVKNFKVGEPQDETTYIGPLTREPQLGILENQIRDAREKGAKLLLGGARIDRKGYWFEPTVLSHVSGEMEVMREESFGPVIGIQKVSGDEEAVRVMNETSYGLTAGVYTHDRERARRILSRVNAGSAYWNCCDRVSPRLPWTGRGHSGMGSTLGEPGILAFVQPKAYHLKG